MSFIEWIYDIFLNIWVYCSATEVQGDKRWEESLHFLFLLYRHFNEEGAIPVLFQHLHAHGSVFMIKDVARMKRSLH